MKISLTSDLQNKIRTSTVIRYVFEISSNATMNKTHGTMTWLDITEYVKNFPSFENKQEYSFNEAQYSPSIKLILSDVNYWISYFNTKNYIEFRVRCIQTTINNDSVGSYTIFGGRIYQEEIEYDYLSDELELKVYSYSETLNKLPAYQLSSYYDQLILDSDDEAMYAEISYLDLTSIRKNILGSNIFEYDSSNGYRWNNGEYSNSTFDIYDFRGTNFGQLIGSIKTGSPIDGDSIKVIAKNYHRGELLNDNIAFSPLKYTHFNRVIRSLCLEAGTNPPSINWQNFILPTHNRRAVVSYIGSTREWYSDIAFSGMDSVIKVVQYTERYAYVVATNNVYIYDGNTGQYALDGSDSYPGSGSIGLDRKVFINNNDGLIYFIDYFSGDVGFCYYDTLNHIFSTPVSLDTGSNQLLYSWNYINTGNFEGFFGIRRQGRAAGLTDLRVAYYDLDTAMMHESAGITQSYSGATYHIVRGERGVACYEIDSSNLGFYVALTTDSVTEAQKMIALTNYNNGTYFSGSISDYKFITLKGKNTNKQDSFRYTTQNSNYAYFVGFGSETEGDLSIGQLRLAIGLSDFSIYEFIPNHESNLDYLATKSFKINEETNDITYASVSSSYGLTYISGRLLGSDFNEEEIEDNKLLLTSSFTNSDCGTSIGESNYYSSSHWYFRIGRNFEPYLGGYDFSTGKLRDIVNDISKTYGMSINFKGDKTVELVSKFSYDKDYIGTGDILTINDSDIKSFEKIDVRKGYDYTKLVSGDVVKTADNANVYNTDIGGESVFDINTGIYIDVISEDVANIRHRTFNDTLLSYKINLSSIYHFLDVYDILSISSDNEERNGNFVIIQVNCKKNNTEIIVCRYGNNYVNIETGDYLLFEDSGKIILEL